MLQITQYSRCGDCTLRFVRRWRRWRYLTLELRLCDVLRLHRELLPQVFNETSESADLVVLLSDALDGARGDQLCIDVCRLASLFSGPETRVHRLQCTLEIYHLLVFHPDGPLEVGNLCKPSAIRL